MPVTRQPINARLLPGYTTETVDLSPEEGALIGRAVFDPDGRRLATVMFVAWPLQVGHSYGWVQHGRAYRLDDLGSLVDCVRALPHLRWPGREIDDCGRPVFRYDEIPPEDAAFAQWRGRTCADEPGKVATLTAEQHEHWQLLGLCVGGWLASGDWWLHCGTCRPDVAATEREELEARDRFLNPQREARR